VIVTEDHACPEVVGYMRPTQPTLLQHRQGAGGGGYSTMVAVRAFALP